MKLMMLMSKDEDLKLKKIHLDDDYEEMFDCLEDILNNPPKTWSKYKNTTDECDSIINMEIQELMDAKETKEFHELEKEYLHCAAAFLYGYKMAKMKHEKLHEIKK